MTKSTPSHPHTHSDVLGHNHPHDPKHVPSVSRIHTARNRIGQPPARSVLAWSAWRRVATVMPIVVALWLAVWWANEGSSLW
jgi:hypothetical protein